MVTRQALLINAPGEDMHLPGVNAALEMTRNFLMSAYGGGWLEEEIYTTLNPDLKTLLKTVKGTHAGYTVTFFSGKGFADHEGRRFLVLNDSDYLEDAELLNNSSRQLVIIDALPDPAE